MTLPGDVPSGWQLASGSSMRVVTFKVPGKAKGSAGAECWVTDLSGAAGGVIDNINRWRGEMDKPPLSAQDVDRLPRIQVLGEQFRRDVRASHHATFEEANDLGPDLCGWDGPE